MYIYTTNERTYIYDSSSRNNNKIIKCKCVNVYLTVNLIKAHTSYAIVKFSEFPISLRVLKSLHDSPPRYCLERDGIMDYGKNE